MWWLAAAVGAVVVAVCYRRAGLRASSVWEGELRRALAWLWAAVAVVFLIAAALAAAA